jgi:hypothetical protein
MLACIALVTDRATNINIKGFFDRPLLIRRAAYRSVRHLSMKNQRGINVNTDD